ncbi:MAG: hypothetical protein Q7S56_01205 [Nanoarchaeota archaeon]|nr:hypothetical protein [Nanoarchaeota archaeon]
MGEISKLEVCLFSLIIGGAIGSVANFLTAPGVNKVKISQRENAPAVMRMYKQGNDGIYVENPQIKGEYILIDDYLKKIPLEADRNIEEGQIKKAVKWYEE